MNRQIVKQKMTRAEIIALLKGAGIDSARYDADALIEHFCKISRAQILAEPSQSYGSPELLCAVKRRASREPLQYIIGSCGFCSEIYEVSEDCLIPRSDTEMLVEWAKEHLPVGSLFADLCTGSGCIAISSLASRPDCFAHAYDVSANALAIAKSNAVNNRVSDRIEFYELDLLKEEFDQKYDMILSNPPYIRTDVIESLAPEVKSEPIPALDGGEDGMIFYERFISSFSGNLLPEGCFVFEIGYDQGQSIKALAERCGMHCEVQKDLSGNDRMAVIKR